MFTRMSQVWFPSIPRVWSLVRGGRLLEVVFCKQISSSINNNIVPLDLQGVKLPLYKVAV